MTNVTATKYPRENITPWWYKISSNRFQTLDCFPVVLGDISRLEISVYFIAFGYLGEITLVYIYTNKMLSTVGWSYITLMFIGLSISESLAIYLLATNMSKQAELLPKFSYKSIVSNDFLKDEYIYLRFNLRKILRSRTWENF